MLLSKNDVGYPQCDPKSKFRVTRGVGSAVYTTVRSVRRYNSDCNILRTRYPYGQHLDLGPDFYE